MVTHRILAAVAAAAVVAGGAVLLDAAMAQTAVAQTAPGDGRIQVGSDTFHIDDQAHTSYFDGRVEIQQEGARLRADHAKIIYSADNTIISIEANGNVYYVAKDTKGQENVMKGDNAVYTQANDTMVVTGAPVILQQGQNVMTGTRLVSQVKAGQTTLESPTSETGKGRVRGVFYSQKNAQNPQAVTVPPSVKPAGQ